MEPTSAIECRLAEAADRAAIRRVHIAAFGGTEEADLVDSLTDLGFALVAVVAVTEGEIAGHVLFSRMWIDDGSNPPAETVALAPVGVFPSHQRSGIGTRLIEAGLKMLRMAGEPSVIVLGSPSYYRRFGFSPETTQFLRSPFPPEFFMGLELQANALLGIRGRAVYPSPFGV